MSEDKAPLEGRNSNESRLSKLKRKRRAAHVRWLKRFLRTVLAGVLTGVLVFVITIGKLPGIVRAAGSLFPSSQSESAPGSGAGKSGAPATPSSAGGVPAAHNPAQICYPQMISENSLDSWDVHAWAFSAGFTPMPGQIAKINEANKNADLINRDLYDDGGYAPYIDPQLILQNNCPRSMIITDIRAVESCQSSPLDQGPGKVVFMQLEVA